MTVVNGAGRSALLERLNLARLPGVQPLLYNRWPLTLARTATLAGFLFTIAAGIFGPAVGSHNFAIVFVWIAWWTALKLVFIPFGGRSWCSVCPLPLPGEWLQQGGLLRAGLPRFGLKRRWPKSLKGTWIQSGAFLLIGLFSAVTLTDARLTAWVLLGLFGLATGLALVFERRAFCSHICPIGGFTGIYARTAPVEVRVIDPQVCREHEEKSCYHACAWNLYPVAQRDSAACGLCMECLRACPHDNLGLNLRPFLTDLAQERPTSRPDEAFLALVMLGSALAFSAVFTGPWGALKNAAYSIGSFPWLTYSLGFLALNLLLLPGLFRLTVAAAQRLAGDRQPWRKAAARWGEALLPLGLAAWIAFTISFAFPKVNLVLGVLSDPVGWGWNLLGLGGFPASLDVSAFSALLQIVVILAGLFFTARTARKLAGIHSEAAYPILAFCLAFSLAMIWLLVG